MVRVEVQAQSADAVLIRSLAEVLRTDPAKAEVVRASLRAALRAPEPRTAFDVFGSDLPDEVFEGVFDAPRTDGWRKIEL